MAEAKFKRGSASNLASLAKEDGSVIFAVKDASSPTTLVFDKAISGTVQRLGVAVSNAATSNYAATANFSNYSGYPQGFNSRTTSSPWGNTTGTHITGWHTSSGGDLAFLNNNPASGQLSLKIDGVFYQREGSYKVIDEGGGTFKGPIALSYNTNNIMSTATTNPQIIFSENGSQPVALAYTDYDSYRNPAGLKVVGKSADSSPAWFEVEGALYSNTVNASTVTAYLNGTASNSNALGGSSLTQVLSAAGSGKFLPLAGGTMTGTITAAIGNQKGIKIGNQWITSANNTNGEVVLQGGHLRFGTTAWDYNQWAGLKYNHSNLFRNCRRFLVYR